MSATEFHVGDARQPTKAVTYGGNQVAYFERLTQQLVMPHGFPVRAEYFANQQITRVEFSPTGPAARPLLQMGQVAS